MRRTTRILSVVFVVFLFPVFGVWAGGTPNTGEAQDPNEYEDPKGLAELIKSGEPEYLLVDVRTPGEYNSGHIPTAVNIPVSEIEAQPPEVSKQELVVVYCRSGSRSSRAAGILESLGYTQVVDFGGIYRWEGELIKRE